MPVLMFSSVSLVVGYGVETGMTLEAAFKAVEACNERGKIITNSTFQEQLEGFELLKRNVWTNSFCFGRRETLKQADDRRTKISAMRLLCLQRIARVHNIDPGTSTKEQLLRQLREKGLSLGEPL